MRIPEPWFELIFVMRFTFYCGLRIGIVLMFFFPPRVCDVLPVLAFWCCWFAMSMESLFLGFSRLVFPMWPDGWKLAMGLRPLPLFMYRGWPYP